MIQVFDTDIATKYGLKEAVVFDYIGGHVLSNEIFGDNYIDGKHWFSMKNDILHDKVFPYLSESSIKSAIKNLSDSGLIVVGKYIHKSGMKWFALTDYGRNVLTGTQIYKPNEFPDDQVAPPKNLSKPDKEEAEKLFLELWKVYPLKRGKGQVSDAKKLKLYRIGKEEMLRCIDRYKKYLSDEGKEQYTMHGSTFFNSGYVDYLDENYSDNDKEESKEDDLLSIFE